MNNHRRPGPVEPRARWRARVALIGMFLLFFGPLLSALWLNIYAPDWQPFGYTNRGDLVVPAVRAQGVGLNALDDRPMDADYLNDRWTLVYVTAEGCNSLCGSALLRVKQVRQALGKDRDRVQRLLIVADNSDQARSGNSQWIGPLQGQYPGLRIASARAGSTLISLGREDTGAVILIDPQAFIMMRFPGVLPVSDMLKDMQRLLKLSKRD